MLCPSSWPCQSNSEASNSKFGDAIYANGKVFGVPKHSDTSWLILDPDDDSVTYIANTLMLPHSGAVLVGDKIYAAPGVSAAAKIAVLNTLARSSRVCTRSTSEPSSAQHTGEGKGEGPENGVGEGGTGEW